MGEDLGNEQHLVQLGNCVIDDYFLGLIFQFESIKKLADK
jgi:hypothetical protein